MVCFSVAPLQLRCLVPTLGRQPAVRLSGRKVYASANTTATRSVFRLRLRFPLFIGIVMKLSILIRLIQRRTSEIRGYEDLCKNKF